MRAGSQDRSIRLLRVWSVFPNDRIGFCLRESLGSIPRTLRKFENRLVNVLKFEPRIPVFG